MIFAKTRYKYNNSLAVLIKEDNGEPYCFLTVCLEGNKTSDTKAFIDVNNCPLEIIKQLEKSNKIENTGIIQRSGFVDYPLYKFSKDFIDSMDTMK